MAPVPVALHCPRSMALPWNGLHQRLRLSTSSPFPGFFVLVLSVSGTRTRCGIFEYEYEYHFIEYEYDSSQNSPTSKGASRVLSTCKNRLAPQAHGNQNRFFRPYRARVFSRRCVVELLGGTGRNFRFRHVARVVGTAYKWS